MRRILVAVCAAVVLAAAGTASASGGSERTSQMQQLRHAGHVLAFFSNPKHRWLSAPNQPRCSMVPWQKSCRIARKLTRYYTVRQSELRVKLDASDPIIQRLERGLRGTPMAGTGRILRDMGKRYNVSPFFMAAAAFTESSAGAAGCGNNPRNVWGLAACDGRWHVPYFNSWGEAIQFYARFVSRQWPSATSPYHFYGYAACDACWGRKTAFWMSSRFGVSSYTKYPAAL